MNSLFKKLDIEDLSTYTELYHGTCSESGNCTFNEIKNIDLSRGKWKVDFGKGFYLTPDLNIAQVRAGQSVKKTNGFKSSIENSVSKLGLPLKRTGQKINEVVPIVLKYPFNVLWVGADTFKYKIFPFPCREWLEFIFNNRSNDSTLSGIENHNKDIKYDMVYGYMADGSFRKIIDKFKKKYSDLTEEEIENIYSVFTREMNITEVQISLHTEDMLNMALSDGEILFVK